jgi:hypothetical protein
MDRVRPPSRPAFQQYQRGKVSALARGKTLGCHDLLCFFTLSFPRKGTGEANGRSTMHVGLFFCDRLHVFRYDDDGDDAEK